MVTDRKYLSKTARIVLCLFGTGLGVSANAQTPSTTLQSGSTVRHRKIAVEDPSLPPELVQAEADIEKKQYSDAEPLLKLVVGRDPKNYQAWFDLGFLYNAIGRPEDSIAAYRKSIEAKQDVFESNLNLGLMLAKTNQPGAEKYLRAATRLKPGENVSQNQELAWMALGRLLESSNPQEALLAYRSAAVLVPSDPTPYLASAPLLEKQNQFAEAEHEYQQVLAIDPKSVPALIGVARIYARGNRFTEAGDLLRQVVAQNPGSAPAHAALARVLAADGKQDAAISEFEAALKIDPSDRQLQEELAQLYTTAGKPADAQALYKSLLAASPNDAELHHALGQAYMKQHNFPAAQQEFLSAVRLKPALGPAYGDLAAAANENKNYDLAIKALDARAKLMGEIPLGYFLRATAYDHLRAYKEASLNYHAFLNASKGQYPDQEWQARHRLITIEPKAK
ncbi:MAG TPA: tetratricopeptide repeat protein [Terriglobales bacterium]|nr:tetratricopeptide repeat protein [Terriglobales bacterium]